MAKYTMELRKVCDIFGRPEVESWFSSYDLKDFLTNEQIEVIHAQNVWSKEKLASKIVNHYFMREIGFETPYLFRHYAITTMNEIMEEYLLKIYTKFLQYDPLSSVDYVEEYTREIENSHNDTNTLNKTNSGSQNASENIDISSSGETSNTENTSSSSQSSENNTGSSTNTATSESTSTNEGSSSSSSSNESTSLNIDSDTPQGRVTKQNILDGVYASKTGYNENESSITDNTTTSNTTTTEGETSASASSENASSSNSSSSNELTGSSSNSNETNTDRTSNITTNNNEIENGENEGGFTTTEKYTHSMKGDNGVIVTNQYLVREFRELAKSFDLEIIEKLNTLFMGVY